MFASNRVPAYLLSALLLLLVFPQEKQAHAQSETGSIEGEVSLADEEQPVAGVNVFLDDANRGTATDAEGRFAIDDVPPGDYELVARLIGYAEVREPITVVPGEVVNVQFELVERPVEASELLVERMSLTGGLTRLDELPGSAHYITAKELKRHADADVNRVLQSVPGVYMQEEDGYGLRPNIGMRGTGVSRTSKITVMEDGVLAAPAPYAAPAAYYFPNIARAHAVEVRKGSSQIKYGPYTTGGAFNMISTPIPSDFIGRMEAVGGEDASRRLHATVGQSYDNVAFMVEGFQSASEGFKHLPGGQNTGYDITDFLGKVRLHTGPDADIYQSLTLKVGQWDETSNETYLGLTQRDFDEDPYRRYAASQRDQMNASHGQYQLRHLIQPAEFVDVTTTLYRNNFHRNWYKLDKVRPEADGDAISISSILASPDTYSEAYEILRGETVSPENSLELKNNNREYYSQGVQSIAGFQFDTPQAQHDLEVGLRLHEDEIDRFQWVDFYQMDHGVMRVTEQGTPGTESNRITNARALAAFAQYRMERGNWFVSPGVRYENIQITRDEFATETESGRERTEEPINTSSNHVDALIPGLGAGYEVSEQFRVFGGVHKGFAPPGHQEETQPEESIAYELGSRFQTSASKVKAVAFLNDYSNLLGRDMAAVGGDPSGEQFNGGAARVWGLELSAAHNLGSWLDRSVSVPVEFNYTLSHGEFLTDFDSDFGAWGEVSAGDHLPYMPPHQLAGSVGLESWNDVSAEVRGRYTGTMRTVAGSGEPALENRVDAHFVLDATLEYAITPQIGIFGSVRNLTDEAYAVARRPAGVRPGLPRTFLLGIRAEM